MEIQGKMFDIPDTKRTKQGKKLYRLPCKQCGLERWVPAYCLKRPNYTGLCAKCSRARLRKDKCVGSDGYIYIKLRPDDFFYPMANSYGYVREHRLIMAKHLHRCLLPWEVVHHKNGVKNDNRLENLELLATSKSHLPSVNIQATIQRLQRTVEEQEKRITLLEAENVALRKALVDRGLIKLVINY